MKFIKQTFTEDISIDYNEFIDCTFKNCTIWFHGGLFSLVNAKFDNVRFGCANEAEVTLSFLRMVRTVNPKLLEQLLNKDQTPSAPHSVTVN